MPEVVNPFQPAVKAQIKARVALDGPTGSGKTWTALKWATVLAGEDGKIAFIDTERRSASLYAPHFTFDVINFTKPYEVPRLIQNMHQAEAAGYTVLVLDSFSHFWEGEGGVLDVVDAAAKRAQGNSFVGWKVGTPLQRNVVDEILDLDMHVIVTMRSKMEYVVEEQQDRNGRKTSVPRKIGMAPVQRAGVEYEFQIVADLDLEHCMTISKSRCDVLADKVIQPHRETEAAREFATWLDAGEPPLLHETVQALIARFDVIPALEERKATKLLFVDCFGRPEHLLANQLEEATAWIDERIAEITGQGTDSAGQAAEPEAEAGEPAGTGEEGPPADPPDPAGAVEPQEGAGDAQETLGAAVAPLAGRQRRSA